MENKRDFTFDIARSLCVVWIVAFWHIGDYIEYTRSPLELEIGSLITMGVLACFSFISGYFLKKYTINGMKDILLFYRKRISRFYLLLFISSTSLYVAGIIIGQKLYTTKQYLSIITGLGCFLDPAPATLWYFSMIIMFYILTPFILMQKDIKAKLIMFCVFYSFLALLKMFTSLYVDARILVYFPIYFLGLLCSKSMANTIKNISWILVIPTVALFLIRKNIPFGFHGIGCVLIAFIIISVSELLSKVVKKGKLFSNISYSSMCAYLFHRHFFLLFVFLTNINGSTSMRDATIPILVAFICVITIFVFSYYIQKLFDYLQKLFFS